MRRLDIAVLEKVCMQVHARVCVAVAKDRLGCRSGEIPLKWSVADLLVDVEDLSEEMVRPRAGVGQGRADPARQLCFVELIDVFRWRRVGPAFANFDQGVEEPLAPHAEVKHEERSRPAFGRGLRPARRLDELLLDPALGFESAADRVDVRQGSCPWSACP